AGDRNRPAGVPQRAQSRTGSRRAGLYPGRAAARDDAAGHRERTAAQPRIPQPRSLTLAIASGMAGPNIRTRPADGPPQEAHSPFGRRTRGVTLFEERPFTENRHASVYLRPEIHVEP